jgi:diadenosine tetraphosphatase ApaH/serine/threonine PP2A family protein phosphatase
LDFDKDWLEPLRAAYYTDLLSFLNAPQNQYLLAGNKRYKQAVGKSPSLYYLFSYEDYPLLWLSSNRPQSHALFQQFFDQLSLAEVFKEQIPHSEQIRMYCGFFVVGNQAPKPLWHYDYHIGAPAFTLITPLFELEPDQGHLLYEEAGGQEQTYHYQLSQALIFGAGFLHSTACYGPSKTLRILVSLTFGSDQWQHWPLIKKNIHKQSRYYCLPCGHMTGTCKCQMKHAYQEAIKRLKEKINHGQ